MRPARGLARALAFAALVMMLARVEGAGAVALRRSVVGSGSDPCSGSGRSLKGTVGQPVVGTSGSETRVLCHGFWCPGGPRDVAVEHPPGGGATLPDHLEFATAGPSPSRGTAHFRLALPGPAQVDLAIYDLAGRRVSRVLSAWLDAGEYRLDWGASRGDRASPGIYFARLAVDGNVLAWRRIVLIN